MDDREREAFWKILCSLPGKDIVSESEKLRQVIKIPSFLYRYRPVNMQSLESLRTNKLYFSSANYYDDPFDTFLHIDVDAIQNEYCTFMGKIDGIEAIVDGAKVLFGGILTEQQIQQLTVENMKKLLSQENLESFLNAALTLRDEIKKDTWSVCFSENGFNESLWLKYADQHRGFVQMYDMHNDDDFFCGKQKKCEICGINKYGTPLYPIYYSDTPYNATRFAMIVMLRKIEEMAKVTLPPELYIRMGQVFWEREKTMLIKRECHKYDEEWRMVTGCNMNPPIMRKWRPSAIIFGLRMNTNEENLVVSMAKEAGIKEIYKSYIDKKNQLSAMRIYSAGNS